MCRYAIFLQAQSQMPKIDMLLQYVESMVLSSVTFQGNIISLCSIY